MGALISGYSDDFTNKYSAHWSWTDGAAQGTFGLQRAGGLQFATQAGELADGQHNAPLFTESAPSGDFVAEVKLHSTLPESGVHNSVESGLIFYQDDSHYLKLVQRALGETRQLEFSRQDGRGCWRAMVAVGSARRGVYGVFLPRRRNLDAGSKLDAGCHSIGETGTDQCGRHWLCD